MNSALSNCCPDFRITAGISYNSQTELPDAWQRGLEPRGLCFCLTALIMSYTGKLCSDPRGAGNLTKKDAACHSCIIEMECSDTRRLT